MTSRPIRPDGKLYANRDPSSLEPHYSAHVAAMTTEGLHAKSDIAAELAWRDMQLARLEAALTESVRAEDLEAALRELSALREARREQECIRKELKAACDTIDDVIRDFGDEYPARIEMLMGAVERIDRARAAVGEERKETRDDRTMPPPLKCKNCGRIEVDHYSIVTLDPGALYCDKYGRNVFALAPLTTGQSGGGG